MICDLVSEECLGGCRGKVLSCFPLKEWSYTNDRQGQIPGVDCHLYCVEKTFSLACRSFAWPFFFPGLNLWPDLGKGRIFSLILDCFTNTGNILNQCRLLPLVCFPFRGFWSFIVKVLFCNQIQRHVLWSEGYFTACGWDTEEFCINDCMSAAYLAVHQICISLI